ncbi:AaceriACR236Wp [[Ashbya] aceris (nom. inval.)]|nr:AaceriACR236Wp [[Ashbya] aceris (nom. inval.)]
MTISADSQAKKSKMLDGLDLKDIIQGDEQDGPGNGGSRRVHRPRDGNGPDYRIHKPMTADGWLQGRIPSDVAEWGRWNPHVDFPDGTKNKVRIRYDPRKLYDFRRVLRASAAETGPPPLHQDFEIYETENLLNMLDNESYPYRGAIANKKDYSTSKTTPTVRDRQFFQKLLFQSANAARTNGNTLLSFPEEETKGRSGKAERAHKVSYIYFNDHEIKTWYTAPYPEEYSKNRILYICDSCLKYMNSKYIYYRHKLKCSMMHPPGNEIYRDGKISIWEIDGREQVIYCQNLCLIAKLFLNSKTLYYDVEPFVFYLLTENVKSGQGLKFNVVGYFSKEKLNTTDYNLSCILVLPTHQRLGYGHLLMDFSYLLSRREFKWGTPEKPLSDLGLLSYRNYWKIKMAQVLRNLKPVITKSTYFCISLEDIANLTGMTPTDVIFGLEQLGCFYKYPALDGNKYAIRIDSWDEIEQVYHKWESKAYITLDPEKLIWRPLIFGPSCGINAVGTMVETSTGAQRNTSAVSSNQGTDLFKNSISVLVNFMHDDISDSRTMEKMAWDKIVAQQKDEGGIQEADIDHARLELAYVHPSFTNGNTAEYGVKNVRRNPPSIRETPKVSSPVTTLGDRDDMTPLEDVYEDSFDQTHVSDQDDEYTDQGEDEEEEDEEDEEENVRRFNNNALSDRAYSGRSISEHSSTRTRSLRHQQSVSHVESDEDEDLEEHWVDALENVSRTRRILRNRTA